MNAYTIIAGIAIAICVAMILFIILGIIQQIREKKRLQKLTQYYFEGIDYLSNAEKALGSRKYIGSTINNFKRKMERANLKFKPVTIIALLLVLGIFGIMIGQYLLNDFSVGILIALILVYIPYSVLNWLIHRREQKTYDELPMAMQLYSIEYEMTKNMQEAFTRTLQSVGEPLNGYLKECINGLAVLKDPEIIFQNLANNLNCEIGRIWCKTLLASVQNTSIVRLMPALIAQLNNYRLLNEKNKANLSGMRRIGMILNILIVPGFITTQLFFPTSREFFTQPLGRFVIILIFLSLLVGVGLDQILRRVDY